MSNLQVVEAMYAAFATGDVPGVVSRLSDDIVWNEAENFPYADNNPYVGPDAVVSGVFGRIMEDWEYWNLVEIQLREMSGDGVLSTGRYQAKNKATGKSISAQFAHVWTLENGKATRFQQYADTLQVTEAMG